jgi:hypothetical protein
MNHVWAKWFEEVGRGFDDYRKNPDIVFTATDGTLYTKDFGKTIRFDTGTTDCLCYLPTISSKDVNCWLTIMRTGTGRLTIIPSVSAYIDYGSAGGRMWCEEKRRSAANLTLQVMTSTRWAVIGATGIWKYR